MRRRLLSLLLCLVTVFQLIPVQSKAADGIEITEIRFYKNRNGSDYVVIDSKAEAVELDYTYGAYKFEVAFNTPSAVSQVYIVATAGSVSKSLGAKYDAQTGRFITEGYFDGSNTEWAPEKLEFRYVRKSTAPAVGSSVNWEQIRGNLSSEMNNAVITETTEGNTTTGNVDMSATVDALKNLDMSYYIKTVDENLGSDLGTLRDYYQNAQNVVAYVLPGVDDSRYYAYLDYSDPNSVKMLVDDGMDTAGTAIEIALEFMDSGSGTAQSLQSVSQALSEAAPIADLLMDSYIIHHDMDQLREEIATSSHIQDKDTAYDAVDKLESDKIAFNVLAYMLPLAAGGAAAGPAGILFTGMIGVMAKAAEWVYEQRIGGITGEKVNTSQTSYDGVVYNNTSYASGDPLYWEYDNGTMRITHNPRGVPVWTTDLSTVECYEKTHTVEYDAGIAYQGFPLPENVSTVIGNGSGGISLRGDVGYVPNLTSMDVPYGTVSFGFTGKHICNLKYVKLPVTITSVGVSGAEYVSSLNVDYAGNMSQWDEIDGSEIYEEYFNVHMTSAGWHGDNVDWIYEEGTQTLIFTGQGDMAEIEQRERKIDDITTESYDYYPWFRISDDVKRIVVGEGITSLPKNIFIDLPQLEEVVLPSTLTSIGNSAFKGCSALKKISIPAGVVSIGEYAFQKCTSLQSIAVEGNVTEIPKYCFDGCTVLASVSLPKTLESIGDRAFRSCTALQKITIPHGVKTISFNAFDKCKGLTSVTIPYTVEDVRCFTSDRCGTLSKVYYGSSKAAWEGAGGGKIDVKSVEYTSEGSCGENLTWDYEESTGILTISGTGTMNSYEHEMGYDWVWVPWHDYRNEIRQVIVKKGVTTIGDMAFGMDNEDEKLYFPDEMLDYPKLSSISLPDTLETIGQYAFSRCSALRSIQIPKSVTYINHYAFRDLTNLDQIWFQGDAPQITEDSFRNVSGTAYYPADNGTWTEEKVQSYQNYYNSELLWQSICKGGCNLVITKGTEATCTQPGYTEGRYCSVCGVIQQPQTMIPANGHSYGQWYTVSDIEQRRDCSVCLGKDVKLVVDAMDMNQDGVITAEDALDILWNSINAEAYPLSGNGDINGDGSVNEMDAQYLIWFTLFPSLFRIS